MYDRLSHLTWEPSSPVLPGEGPMRREQRPLRRVRGRRVLIGLLCLLLLAAGGVGTLIVSPPFLRAALFHTPGRSSNPGAAQQSIVGHAYFESSGQINAYSSAGINDELQLELSNIPGPAANTSYYAWLVSGSIEGRPVFLGQLSVTAGQAHLFYAGDPEHTNLLGTGNRLLITDESASVPPSVPSPDRGRWRYAFAFSQALNQQEMPPYSLLDHLHHLLSQDPDLDTLGLQGGLNTWLFRDTQKVLEWAGSASSSWGKDAHLIHRQLVRILQYLEGLTFAWRDLPPGTPLLVDPRIARVALLESDVEVQQPPGLLYHIGLHLHGIAEAPGASQAQRDLTTQLDTDLNIVGTWMEQLRRDAVELVFLTPQQLASASALALLNDLTTQATYGFSGRLLPSSNTWQLGVMQITDLMPTLASMDIVPVQCTTKGNGAGQQALLCL